MSMSARSILIFPPNGQRLDVGVVLVVGVEVQSAEVDVQVGQRSAPARSRLRRASCRSAASILPSVRRNASTELSSRLSRLTVMSFCRPCSRPSCPRLRACRAALDVVQVLVLAESGWGRRRRAARRPRALSIWSCSKISLKPSTSGRSVSGPRIDSGWQALGERADLRGVVEGLDVLARAGDGDRVEQLEEVEVEHRAGCASAVRSSAAAWTTR